MGLTTPQHKIKVVTKCNKRPRIWADSLDKRPKLKKMDMELRSVYRAGSLMTVVKESQNIG
jgi:hypothetical protein